jgi:sarcosine oxidase
VGSQKPGPGPDIAVVGLGATGSATAWALARRGLQVICFEQYSALHPFGSSHGRTRIIREAYFEHPLYVPLVQRAFELWDRLEQESGRVLLRRTGGLMIGRPETDVFAGALRAAREHGLAHEVLGPRAVRQRFAGLEPADDMEAVLEPRAGVLMVEACLGALQQGARDAGADFREDEAVTAWTADEKGVAITTAKGAWRAGHLVLCAGPWLPRLVPALARALAVERQLSHWFAPAAATRALTADRCPVTIWEHAPGQVFYTIPDFGDGFKAGIHHDGERVDPDTVRREPAPDDEARVRALLARFVPSANGPLRDARVCLYTNAPDGHFLLDRHPASPRVLVVSPCSGHGFKFAPAIGEAAADLVTDGRSRFDLAPFALARLV